jgi:hypothetical protein
MNTLSKTSKLDGIRSWSLQAAETCPGRIFNNEVVDACKGCYATAGNYYLPNVIKKRADNKLAWQERGWVNDIVMQLQDEQYFRWFDSGDMYTMALAKKIYTIMKRTPWISHWLPTRMYRFAKFAKILADMQALPNVMVRSSSDSVEGNFEAHHGSTIVSDESEVKDGVKLCESFKHEGKCNGCRACYSKKVPVIAYKAHSNRMRGVIKLVKAR